jgi:N-acetylglucosamine-6-sulfatase
VRNLRRPAKEGTMRFGGAGAAVGTAFLLFLVLLVALPLACGAEAREAPKKPNIVFIMVDDMRYDELAELSYLQEAMLEKGILFENAYVTNPLCCPSRVTALTGRYSSNHGVMTNIEPQGGYEAFQNLGLGRSTVATWLNGAGYDTAFFGKSMNGQEFREPVPAGWDRFRLQPYRRPAMDPQIGTEAARWVARHDRRPVFLALWLWSPHEPYEPAPGFAGTRDGATFPRSPSYDEEDVSDKPAWFARNWPRLTEEQHAQIPELRERRLEMLDGAAAAVRSVMKTIRRERELSNTYVIFTSDNGFLLGEHRLVEKKIFPYEESAHVPLVIQGPGVPAGERRAERVANNDLAPTIARMARVSPQTPVDGRSLLPLLRKDAAPEPWRNSLMIEHPRLGESWMPAYEALKTERYLYVEWEDGGRELYDGLTDPYQTESIYDRADPALVSHLEAALDGIRECPDQASCSAAEAAGT